MGWFFFSIIEALGIAFSGFLLGIIQPTGWRKVILPTCLWVLIEWLQGLSEFGFTWGRLAISQYKNIFMIQSSNLFGSLFITGLIVFFNTVISLTIINYFKHKNRDSLKMILIAFAILILEFL